MTKQLLLGLVLSVTLSPALADDDDYRFYKEYKGLVENIEKNTGDINLLTGQVTQNTADIQELTTQIQNIPTGTLTLGAQVQANTDAITSANAQILSNTGAITSLNIDVQSLSTNLTTTTAQVTTNTNDISTLSNAVAVNNSLINNNAAKITLLENSGGGGTGATTYNHSIYTTRSGTKEYQLSGGTGTCNLVRQSITSNAATGGTQIIINETLTDGVQDCSVTTYEYLANNTGLFLVSQTDQANNTISFDAAGEILTAAMEIGKSFGFAIVSTTNPGVGLIRKNTLLDVVDITLPIGTFSNCLKMHSQIASSLSGNVDQVSWWCGGLGEVKRTYFDQASGQLVVMELTSSL